eukprot:753324-Hanusia_phi.AAC.1
MDQGTGNGNDDAMEKGGDMSVNGSPPRFVRYHVLTFVVTKDVRACTRSLSMQVGAKVDVRIGDECIHADESKSWKTRLSGLLPSFVGKPKSHKPNSSTTSESSSGSKKSDYSRRVQELRELVPASLDFGSACAKVVFSLRTARKRFGALKGGEKHSAAATSHAESEEPRQAPTTNFISMYGVHVNTWWVGTSRIMLGITFIMVGLVSFLSLQLVIHRHYGEHVLAWAVGAVFMAVSVPISLHDIHMHILHYVSPLQRHYIRILWMVPIYSVSPCLQSGDSRVIFVPPD